jgi:peptidoglycan hydrolase CwlO-like protein
MNLQFNKGMAGMIRAVLNIDPETLQGQINGTIQQAEHAFKSLHENLHYFRSEISSLRKEVAELKAMMKGSQNGTTVFVGETFDTAKQIAAENRTVND